MTRRAVHYHHLLDKRFSLEYVTDDAAEFAGKYADYDSDAIKAVGYPFEDRTIYCLYTQTGESGRADDLEITEEEIITALEPMNPDRERPIALGLLSTWDGVRDEEEQVGDGLEIYKSMDLERIPGALNRVNWEGTATETAGTLMSNLILRHVLPNANHRCSISLLETYLICCTADESPGYNSHRLHTKENEWKTWVDPYINQSKRILDVRRNNVRFNALRKYGVDVVIQKGGIETELADWNLDMTPSDAQQMYAEKHERLCIQFAEEMVERAGASSLSDRPGLSQEAFARMLSEGIV